MSNTVTEALYQAFGKPELRKALTFVGPFKCGNCKQEANVAPAAKVLTSRFGSWDDIAVSAAGGRWLCVPCAWAYLDARLRRAPYLVNVDGTGTHIDQEEVHRMLTKPLPSTEALLYPVGGKRIVAPRARWGKVAADHGAFTWSRRHADALAAAIELRGYGFGEKSLTEQSPPFPILVSIDVAEHPRVHELWRLLRETRADKTMAPTILKMSRPTP